MFVQSAFDPAEGAAPPLVWPPSLVDRARSPKLCYLDLNQWIYLAKAATGHPDGRRHLDTLKWCLGVRERGSVLFPLADSHYVEMATIKDPTQRQALAEVMEDLSGFATLLSRPDVLRLELDAVLSEMVGPPDALAQSLPLLGYGVHWAFGRVGMRIRKGEDDVTERFATDHPEIFGTVIAEFERRLLAGPADSDVVALRERGWRPDAGLRVAENRAQQEREQAERFNANEKWRRGRLRDVILARETVIELFDMLTEALSIRGIDLRVIFGDRDLARRLVRSMPSSEVSTELKRAAHRNRQTTWTANDIIDIDAMSLATPYCDVVVTEKHRAHLLRAAHLDRRMDTIVLDRLIDLPRKLDCSE